MASFVTEDGKGGISGDAFMREYYKEHPYENYEVPVKCVKKYHTDVEKLKVPTGKNNRHRINNISDYDLLCHIQSTLSLTGRCIIEMITNEDHLCIKTNDTIQRRIHQFAEKFITEEFKRDHPKTDVRFKVEGTEDRFDYRPETDEEWIDRLCHLIMHRNHPNKLQMIKCEECLQCWLNSDKW